MKSAFSAASGLSRLPHARPDLPGPPAFGNDPILRTGLVPAEVQPPTLIYWTQHADSLGSSLAQLLLDTPLCDSSASRVVSNRGRSLFIAPWAVQHRALTNRTAVGVLEC